MARWVNISEILITEIEFTAPFIVLVLPCQGGSLRISYSQNENITPPPNLLGLCLLKNSSHALT